MFPINACNFLSKHGDWFLDIVDLQGQDSIYIIFVCLDHESNISSYCLSDSILTFFIMTSYEMPAGTDLSESMQPTILAVNIIGFVLSAAAVGLRLVARKMSNAPLWWDDWMIVLALVCLNASRRFS